MAYFINNRKTVFGLLAVGLFIYSVWEVVLFMKETQQNKQTDILDCVSAASRSERMTEEQANKYCTCFLTYIKGKYSTEQLVSIDSIIDVEMDKAKECIDNATK